MREIKSGWIICIIPLSRSGGTGRASDRAGVAGKTRRVRRKARCGGQPVVRITKVKRGDEVLILGSKGDVVIFIRVENNIFLGVF